MHMFSTKISCQGALYTRQEFHTNVAIQFTTTKRRHQRKILFCSSITKTWIMDQISRENMCEAERALRPRRKHNVASKFEGTAPYITYISFCFVAFSKQIQRRSRSYSSLTGGSITWISAGTRETSRLGQGTTARSVDYVSSLRKRNHEYLRKARRIVQSWSR